MKNENGFTLVEMMIVLFVITILLLITIPNVSSHQKIIGEKGCEGLVNMVQAQVQAYWIDEGEKPGSLDVLKGDYLSKDEDFKCPDGRELTYNNGVVSVSVPPSGE